MPLIDDHTRGTDRRPTSWWPWVLVIVGIALLWVMLAFVISVVPRLSRRTPPVSPVQQAATTYLDQARQVARYGDWATAARMVQSVEQLGGSGSLSVSDRHTYFRTGARALTQTGSPLAGSKYYERFLSWSTQLGRAECQECHGPSTGIAPRKLADMKSSKLGAAYAAALRSARKLRSRRDALKAELKKKPADPRLHLLLYHLEKALGNKKAAAAHAQKL